VNRKLLLATVLIACVVAGGTEAYADSGAVTATPVARVRFPDRGFLINLPTSRQLSPRDVVVRENGELVPNPSLAPVESSHESLGTVLVLDTSDSMKGRPLSDALTAMRQFAAQFSGDKEKIGLLTFNASWRLVLRPSASGDLAGTLALVPLTREGTHIYDALAQALNVIHASKLAAGSIVLLSDGADTGSKTRETALVTRARRMHVRVFTVGLHSGQFAPAPLKRLASSTGGSFAEATTSASLAPIFGSLGHRLANEYLLRYRSSANPGAAVVVTLRVRGLGLSTFDYTSPKVVAVGAFHRSVLARFWSSIGSLMLISLFAAALVGVAVAVLVHRPASDLRKRIAEFASLASAKQKQVEEKPLLSSRLLGGTERSLARTQWWARFHEELEIANIRMSAEQIIGLAVVGTLLAMLLLYRMAPVFALFGLGVPAIVYGYCRRELRRVRWSFESQLPDNLQVLASALRAGHSFVGALSVVAADAFEPSKREFTRIVADEQLGVPLEDSLREVARRMDNSDLEQVALVAELQRRSGGNMAEVLDRVVDTVRNRFDLRRMVRTLTAQGRLARWILTFLPVFLAGIIGLLDPSYMKPLFTSSGGQVVVAIAAVMVIMGSLAIKRIVEIKV
jgi:tight adherence protein B